MFQRFTERARRVVVLAQEEARLLNHAHIGTEHLLLGLLHEGDGVAARALEILGVELGSVRDSIIELVREGTEPPRGHVPFTAPAKATLEHSLREALQLGHNYIGTEHILLGLIREGQGVGSQVLQQQGVDLHEAREKVIKLLGAVESGEDPFAAADDLTGRLAGPDFTATAHGLPGLPGERSGGVVGQINPLPIGPRLVGLLVLVVAGVLAGDPESSLYSAGAIAAIVGVVFVVIRGLFAGVGRVEGVGLGMGGVAEAEPQIHLPIEALDLSAETRNTLRRAEIKTVGELVQRTEDELLNIANFGPRELGEVDAKLDALGLFFGEQLPRSRRNAGRWTRVVHILEVLALGTAAVLFFASAI